jgi:ketosteroid isomerase-like protein
MSQENVELVRNLQPPPGVDLSDVFMRGGDDSAVEAALDAASEQFTAEFVCVFHGLSSEPRPGVRGLREAWLDWLEPWETYRVELEDLRDAGDRVLVTSRDFGRRDGMADEVELKGSAVWTIRDGKVARAEFFTDRLKAYDAAGLRE